MPELAVTVALDGFNVRRLEFDRWRVANGRHPEYATSERLTAVTPQADADRCLDG